MIMMRWVCSRCLLIVYLPAVPTWGGSPVHSRTDQKSANRTVYSRLAWYTSVTVAVISEPTGMRDLMASHCSCVGTPGRRS